MAGDALTVAPRLFTLDEANRTLPLVRRIVRDIVAAYPAFEERARRLRRELTEMPAGGTEPASLTALREETDAQAARINELIRELQSLGCTFKGFEEGLVDFTSALEDRLIQLCWKHDEETIGWWHEVDGGFVGRTPLTSVIAQEIRAAVARRR